ncbi:hypothetical protein ABZU32_39625 [Sphaerisporangium sp. NPDC005288]|uniref:hypothetical protein n=1 Tax=Sphaerisporangium sp. NPDC005288 TaxID=3155114 RepID=UPI0033B8DC16
MTVIDTLMLLLGLAVAAIIALLAGILTWWQNHSLPAAILGGGLAFAGTFSLWLIAVQTLRSL